MPPTTEQYHELDKRLVVAESKLEQVFERLDRLSEQGRQPGIRLGPKEISLIATLIGTLFTGIAGVTYVAGNTGGNAGGNAGAQQGVEDFMDRPTSGPEP